MPTKREVLVRNLRLDSMADQLPDCVFPLQIAVRMDRSQSRDGFFPDLSGDPISQPKYPVSARSPSDEPYVPPSTVWLANPAEFPDSGAKQWTFDDFTKRLAEIEQAIETRYPKALDRFYLTSLRMVEVPEEYVEHNRDGSVRGVDTSIYTDRQRVAIATFDKRSKIHDEDIRRELGGSLPGNVIKPLKLTHLKEVSLKQFRGSNETTGDSTRRKYFSTAQAEQYNDIGLEPKPWDDPIWSQVEEFFPKLSESEFVDEIEFEGEYVDSETFVEKSVCIITKDSVEV